MSLLTGMYTGQKIHIENYDKNIHLNDIICFGCKNKIIAKKGNINIHHFAHSIDTKCIIIRDSDCKTPWHILWQNIAKPEYLEKIIINDEKMHIADIVNDENLIIEIQHSNLSVDKIQSRELFYNHMIWILDGTDKINKDNNTCSEKCSNYFTTSNNFDIIKVSPRFWNFMKKKKFIDVGTGLYEIITQCSNNFYICKFIEYEDFLNKYYKNILKTSIETTIDILNNFTSNKYDEGIEYVYTKNNLSLDAYTQKEINYCEKTNTFYGPGTYYLRSDLFKIGFVFDKNQKKWIQDKYNI